MSHLNHKLDQEARQFIAEFVKTATFISATFDVASNQVVHEDTGEPLDLTQDGYVGDFLNIVVGEPTLGKTLRQVLRPVLCAVAAEHVKDPAKAVERFLTDLRYRLLPKFLSPPDDGAITRHERAVRTNLAKIGFALRRSRTRDPLRDSYGQCVVVGVPTGCPIIEAPSCLIGIEQWADDVRDGRLVYQ
jgi:hypothetical protein